VFNPSVLFAWLNGSKQRKPYRGGGGPFGVDKGVLDAVGRIGTAGVLEAAARTDSAGI
jgi:hypothetical protein